MFSRQALILSAIHPDAYAEGILADCYTAKDSPSRYQRIHPMGLNTEMFVKKLEGKILYVDQEFLALVKEKFVRIRLKIRES